MRPLLLSFALLAAGCSPQLAPVGASTHDEGAADLGLGPSRPRRRMDLEQLDASIHRATGGVGWDDGNGNSILIANGSTLGLPDYLRSTSEDLNTSAIFLKFLSDAAQATCSTLVARETEPTTTQGVLFGQAPSNATMSADGPRIRAQLARLLLRFHGRRVRSEAPELERWSELYANARALRPEEPTAGWRMVCVALLTHPDFYSY
jgi:hypothetical protein